MLAPAKRSDHTSTSPVDPTAALVAPLDALSGVGPALARALARLLGREQPRLFDLLCHLPRGRLDPRPAADPDRIAPGEPTTLLVTVEGPPVAGGRGRPWRLPVSAGGRPGELVWFNLRQSDWLARRFSIGASRLVHGRLGRRGDRFSLPHPELLPDTLCEAARPVPLYPLVEGLSQARLRTLVARAAQRLPELPEWLGPAAAGRPSFATALRILHGLAEADPAAFEAARRRLALDELLSLQLALAIERRRREAVPGRPTRGDGRLVEAFLASLPFAPTADQRAADRAIAADLARPVATTRLLMGDVGSGKTLVAALALLRVAEAGRQAALLAPTELLARQHQATLARWLAPLGLEPALLVGGEPAAARRATLARLADGVAPIVVGTHALLEPAVAFADLALAVIDEQHRFGVRQRLALVGKGSGVDLLLLSATPIPRTLRLALLGDLAVSELRAKPAGRMPIDTRVIPLRRLEEVIAACGRALARGERLYWICPAIEGESRAERAAALDRFEELRARFGPRVGLAHGRQKASERAAVMAAFAAGRITLLVATTVVEVGVDVPEATVIVIENAERFGLAQLHQLRGRVGRGSRPSTCLLLWDEASGQEARARLATLRSTEDGFAIAEADLALRGPGEILGARQSGLPELRLADLSRDGDLLLEARTLAAELLSADPGLASARGRASRYLLQLFERTAALGLLAAG
ncbi:MAG: ATP-dependent DNA helicase RecG [Geminicoccaceae bacterium]|nr:ATP-dependent DNA helicase RecG [Geminicoccaceae bacterium]